MNERDKQDGAYAAEATVAREKNWSELGIEEKVERLRRVLRRVEHLSSNNALDLGRIDSQFQAHAHAADGTAMVRLSNRISGLMDK